MLSTDSEQQFICLFFNSICYIACFATKSPNLKNLVIFSTTNALLFIELHSCKMLFNLSETTSNDDSCSFHLPNEYTSKFSFLKGFNFYFLTKFLFTKHFSDPLSHNILAKILFLPPETDTTRA